MSSDQARRGIGNLLERRTEPPETEAEIARELTRRGLEWAMHYVGATLPTLHESAGVMGEDEKRDDPVILAMQLLHHAELQVSEFLGRVVALAVQRGDSWSTIAECLECTRQGAQKRFSPVVTILATDAEADTVARPTGRRARHS
jgi:hypothetical protein